MSAIDRQQTRIDALCLECSGPALFDWRIIENRITGVSDMPPVSMHFAVKLPGPPTCIAERNEPVPGPLVGPDHAQDVYCCRQAPAVGHLDALLPAPVERMKDKPALRLDRAAGVDWQISYGGRVNPELLKQCMEPQAWHDPTDADAQSTVFIMLAHCDDRAFEAGIADAGHGEEEFSGQERRGASHRGSQG